MKRISCFVFLLCYLSVSAQKKGQARIDSLITVLPSITEDTARVNLLVDIGGEYTNFNATEGLRFALQAIDLAQKITFNRGLLIAYNSAGNNARVKGEYAKAIGYNEKGFAIAEKLNDQRAMANFYGAMASNYFYQGFFPKSLEYSLKALKVNESIGYKPGIGGNYSTLGNVYASLKEYNKSIENYERALHIYEELGNKRGIAVNSGNAGYIFVAQNNFEKALQYISRSQALYVELGNKDGSASNLQAMGRIYQAQHNYAKAVSSYEEALKIAESVGNKLTMAQNTVTIGEAYLLTAKDSLPSPFKGDLSTKKGLLAKALQNTNRAIALRTEMNDLNGLNFAYDTKSEIELLSGDAIASLASFKEHIRYRDSVFNIEKTKEINRRELQFEFGKREDSLKFQQELTTQRLERQQLLGKQQEQALILNRQQLQLISKEKDLQRLTYLQEQAKLQREKEVQSALLERNKLAARISKEASDKQIAQQQLQISFDQKVKIYLGIAVASILFIAFLVYYNQQKTKRLNRIIGKQKAELEELGHVKDRIFSVVSHDMRTPVNTLISFIDILEDEAIPQEKLQLYAGELKNQLSHTSVLMENLLNWASSQMEGFTPLIETLSVKDAVDQTIALLQQQAAHKNISITNHIKENMQVRGDRNMFALIIRNLLSNAIKFTPANGSIQIDSAINNKEVAIKITDTGTGMSPAKMKSFNDPEYLHAIDTKKGTQGETGTGLGLMLCKTFAGLMKGSMKVESVEGEGSVFTIALPGNAG
jgi:signal transduction histidine kinase/tetratricopeptide (TPR) repeat protein